MESLLYLESAPRYLDASQKILELFGNGFNEALKYIVIEYGMDGWLHSNSYSPRFETQQESGSAEDML